MQWHEISRLLFMNSYNVNIVCLGRRYCLAGVVNRLHLYTTYIWVADVFAEEKALWTYRVTRLGQ